MNTDKIGKWAAWILGALLSLLSYAHENPHPNHTPSV
jgi:hypothetical protein